MIPTPLPNRSGVRRVEVKTRKVPDLGAADIQSLEEMATRMDEIAEGMGQWQPGSGLIHRVNNTRLLVMGEAHRLRRMVERLKKEQA